MNTQILSTLSNVALAGLFTQVTGKETRRFESVKVGAKRVAEALAERNLTVEIEDGAPVVVTQVTAAEEPAEAALTTREVVASLSDGTAGVYNLLLANADRSGETDGKGRFWAQIYLDNARPAWMPARTFAATLSVLTQAGLYRTQGDDHFGLVLTREIDVAAPIGIKGGAEQLDAHVAAFISADDEAAEAGREDELAGERERDADDAIDASALVADVRARITGKPAAAEDNGMGEYIRRLRSMPNERRPGKRVMDCKPGVAKEAAAAGEPRGKSAALVAAARADAGVTNEEIRALTGWTKLGGFFGATQRAGLKLHRCREGSDTRWFGVPADEAGVRAYTQADGRWIPVGQFETAADALAFAEAEAAGQGVTVTMTEGDKGAVFLHTAAAQAAAA